MQAFLFIAAELVFRGYILATILLLIAYLLLPAYRGKLFFSSILRGNYIANPGYR
jgi:hypothetical protein